MTNYFNPYLPPTHNAQPKKRVFISFHMQDLFAKKLIEEQAKSDKFQLEFVNYSLQQPFDNSWKTQCTERIRQCSVTMCLIGKQTATREAVLWELRKSYELGKAVFGVTIYNNDPYLLIPDPLIVNRAPIIAWNMQQIQYVLNNIQ